MRTRLQEQASALLIGVLGQSRKTGFVSNCVKSYTSVFITGAGLSFESGMPLHKVLDQLLRFCEAKDYSELRNDEKKCLKFKHEFARRCCGTDPSISHELIAGNCGVYIREVICMNWDNLIEQAARKLNKEIPKVNEEGAVCAGTHLWKFHGDVENVKKNNIRGNGGWVFPDEQGYVFDCFLRYLEESKLKEEMFTLVIVGYNEQEKDVYEKVIVPMEKTPPRPTFRIGLNLERLHEEGYLVGPADYVLESYPQPDRLQETLHEAISRRNVRLLRHSCSF